MSLIVPLVPLRGGQLAPQLGLGTWRLNGRAGRRTVEAALEFGYRHIDTAESYGNEADIGKAIGKVPREQLFLVSKVWPDHLERDDVRRVAHHSLRDLRTDWLDLLLIHWPNDAVPLERTVAAFRELVDEGLIRGWGVSNFSAGRVARAAALGDPATNQVELHPYFSQEALAATCRAHAIPLTAYSPLAKGRVSDDPTLRRIADAHGAAPAQVALRWATQLGHIVIPKAAGEAHLRANLAAFDITLSDDDMRAIAGLPQGGRLVTLAGVPFDDDLA